MSAKQKAKHIADREPKFLINKSELDAAPTSPDGLGAWEGGLAHRSIDGAKAKPQRTGDTKNTPGVEYASKITHRQDADFNEIHTDANGDFWLYNAKTDAWDIKGDAADLPYYKDESGKVWAYNFITGAWDVRVTREPWEPEMTMEYHVESTPTA